MKQLCLTCKSVKNLHDITYKTKKADWKLKMGIKGIFPNDIVPDLKKIKEKHPDNFNVTQVITLKPTDSGKYLFYYASDLKSECSKIPSAKNSYNKFLNNGIAKIDKNGKATLKLRCPNVYCENKNTYFPHLHFILSNKKNTSWENKLYSKLIICNVSKEELQSAIDKKCTMILNALPYEYYIKKRIPLSISLPNNTLDKVSKASVVEYLKTMLPHYPRLYKKVKSGAIDILDIPIITYCYKPTCDASEQLANNLMKMGFKNIKEYPGGVLGWFKSNKKRGSKQNGGGVKLYNHQHSYQDFDAYLIRHSDKSGKEKNYDEEWGGEDQSVLLLNDSVLINEKYTYDQALAKMKTLIKSGKKAVAIHGVDKYNTEFADLGLEDINEILAKTHLEDEDGKGIYKYPQIAYDLKD